MPDGYVLRPILRDVDLRLDYRTSVLISGPSGSGKSTLLNILGLLDRPSAGSYWLDGVDVAALNDDERSELRGGVVGFVFQHFHLLPTLSVLENVLMPSDYTVGRQSALRDRAEDLLAIVGLADRFESKPMFLSGGEQQRVAIARALLREPKLLLADEPTGALDGATAEEVRGLLMAAVQEVGSTAVLVSHDVARYGPVVDRHFTLVDGRLTPAEGVPR
ncbi:MAG: ABC transporter ATP-binding protein [Actinobacteria bacterium]|nr:ABC transporter ATP-binding protein [Actinomycetota bacterium]